MSKPYNIPTVMHKHMHINKTGLKPKMLQKSTENFNIYFFEK